MKKIAILLVFIMAIATAIEPIDAKPRRSSSRRSSSSYSRTTKRTTSSWKKIKINTGNSSTSKKSTNSSGTSKKSTNSSGSTTSNNSYTVKKKTSDSIKSTIIPKLYKNYSRNKYYRRGSNLNFWKYYGLYHLFNDDDDEISEAELVRNLEEQGYTEEEIEQILEDADLDYYEDDDYSDDIQEDGKSFSIVKMIIFGVGGLILVAGVVIFIMSMINRKSM